MTSEETVDPRTPRSRPTQEEIDAWAERERRRRAAWLAGPSEEDRRAWARHYRWRAALGLEESRLGPLPEEVDQWAEREHKRRQEWISGPTDAEQREWLRRHAVPLDAGAPASAAAPPDELEGWLARERRRRQQWLAGPDDTERAAWAERQAQGGLPGVVEELLRLPEMLEHELPDALQSFAREAELVAQGLLYSVSRAPYALRRYLARAGTAFEEELDKKPRRRRVHY